MAKTYEGVWGRGVLGVPGGERMRVAMGMDGPDGAPVGRGRVEAEADASG